MVPCGDGEAGQKKRPARQDAAIVGKCVPVMQAGAMHVAAQVAGVGLLVAMDMVSVEMDSGNEKPRTGVGAGFLIESGFLRLRASSSRTCGFGNKHEYKQRSGGAGRARRWVGGGVALQHGPEITMWFLPMSSLVCVLCRASARDAPAMPATAAWLPLKTMRQPRGDEGGERPIARFQRFFL